MAGVQDQSAPLSKRSPDSARSPPPREESLSSQFAFTPYERPLNFPPGHTSTSAAHRTSPPAAPQQQSEHPRIKRDPHEEDADALERLRDGHVAVDHGYGDGIGAPPHVKVKTEEGVIKREEYDPIAEMRAMQGHVRAEEIARAGEGMGGARVKQEQEDGHVDMPVRVKVEQGVGVKTENETRARNVGEQRPDSKATKQEEQLVKLEADVQNFPVPKVKPEPVDDHIPKPPPPNRRFDPFDGYGEFKKEEEIELNSSQAPSTSFNGYRSSSAYPPHPSPRVKQEEFASSRQLYSPRVNVKQESGTSGYGYDSRMYSPAVKQEYNGDRGYGSRGTRIAPVSAPSPSSFPRQNSVSDNSRSSHSNSNSSSSDWHARHPGNRGDYAPARQASRTFSPSPHPVKREREEHDDHRPYDSRSREPPIKRERTEPHFSGCGLSLNVIEERDSQHEAATAKRARMG
ncbi:hypothetical protein MVEN_00626100 [Mycena venus]|uniref:Uncharacterized protein n=1 Tax=Mycena venus TaxID=2733690 RepID=A0A8H6YQM8_9AGAR|nr:hypothetical protein MVEN_00626100 [Mycena venus]